MIGESISHYRILEKLGEGGMGIIYKAEDLKLKRTVALKVLPESFTKDEETKQRFILEAQSASSLQHNNICTIHEFDDTEDGQFFIAMDYYEGETLKNKIRKVLLSIDEIIDITIQIAEGLKKAHESGIIHRDIKPANILITKDGTIKILDFGLAKKIDQTQFTKTGIKFGTTDYMSPEQIKGEKIDHRTDIWSLGVLLYEMLTGKAPFHADYEQTIIYLILNEEPEEVSNYRVDVSERLLHILKKSIAKNKNDRYDDLTYMLEDLKKVGSKNEVESFEFELLAPRASQSIAVLPFVNMSEDPKQEYFCDGLTEELINALSRIQDLKVVARTSAFAFKGSSYDIRNVGKKLEVRTVLEGSVRKSGNRLRITSQLINVMDGYHLWSERFDREQKDMFDIQDEITLAIVDALKIELLSNEKEKLLKRYTDNIEAYNLYLQGIHNLYQFNFKTFNKAIEYFVQALEREIDYAPAYYGLGACYFALGWFGLKRSSEVSSDLKKCIWKIMEIDKNYYAGYDLLGMLKGPFEWKWKEAESAWNHCVELNANDAMALSNYSINRVAMKQFDTAEKLLSRARMVDPLSDYVNVISQYPKFSRGKFNLVVESLSKYAALEPPFWWGLWFLWRALSLLNEKEKAVEICKKSFAVLGLNDIVSSMDKAGIDNAIGVVASILAEIYKYHYSSPYQIALLFIHAGKNKDAFTWLEEAVNVADPQAGTMNADPEWCDLRSDSRFISLIRTMDIPL
jgi:serine/threonine protein kinase